MDLCLVFVISFDYRNCLWAQFPLSGKNQFGPADLEEHLVDLIFSCGSQSHSYNIPISVSAPAALSPRMGMKRKEGNSSSQLISDIIDQLQANGRSHIFPRRIPFLFIILTPIVGFGIQRCLDQISSFFHAFCIFSHHLDFRMLTLWRKLSLNSFESKSF